MAELKTKQTNEDVRDFILAFADNEQKRNDSFEIPDHLQQTIGFEPRM